MHQRFNYFGRTIGILLHTITNEYQIVDVLFVLFTLLIVDSSEYFTKCSCPYLAKCSRNRSKDVSVRRNQMTKKKTRKKPTKNTSERKRNENLKYKNNSIRIFQNKLNLLIDGDFGYFFLSFFFFIILAVKWQCDSLTLKEKKMNEIEYVLVHSMCTNTIWWNCMREESREHKWANCDKRYIWIDQIWTELNTFLITAFFLSAVEQLEEINENKLKMICL